jgi:hypothetical protein
VQAVSLLPVDLARWDRARPGDLLFVPVWTDVRPLRGAAGLLDWRMCGRLSGFLLGGQLTGAEGEQMLFPTGNRLVWRLVLVAGAGPRAEFTEKRLRALVRRTLGALRGLKVSRVAMALPGRDGDAAGGALSARRALDVTLNEIEQAGKGQLGELSVIVPASAQKDLTEVLRLRAVRS